MAGISGPIPYGFPSNNADFAEKSFELVESLRGLTVVYKKETACGGLFFITYYLELDATMPARAMQRRRSSAGAARLVRTMGMRAPET